MTEQIVGQCVALGVRHGLAAVQMCKDNGIAVIPGACPNQFLKTDFGHAMMRGMFRLLAS
jgi:hypothetical protein